MNVIKGSDIKPPQRRCLKVDENTQYTLEELETALAAEGLRCFRLRRRKDKTNVGVIYSDHLEPGVLEALEV